MNDDSRPPRIKAFVGRSFHQSDEPTWLAIRKVLESLRPIGFVFEDAQEAQLKPISEKVRHGIERNDIYLGILMRRLPIEIHDPKASFWKRIVSAMRSPVRPSQWTPSEWVVQESGFALGRSKKVLLLIERGVAYPTTDLDADTEWISFDRDSVPECSSPLVQMIANLIAEELPVVTPSVLVAQPSETIIDDEHPKEAKERAKFGELMGLLDRKEFDRADKEFKIYLDAQPEGHFKQVLPSFYLAEKYVRGDTESLKKLKDLSLNEPENFDAITQLARCYRSFKAYGEAAKILLEGAASAPLRSKARLLRAAASDLAEDKQYDRSIQLIVELLPELTHPEDLRLTFLALADVAKHQGDRDLESATLERALDASPADSIVRFRLAYLYGEMNKHHLAIYHYQLLVDQARDPMALNNLGVSFAALNLKGKEIEMYEAAKNEISLARANLSHAYIDRGFLEAGEDLAVQLTANEEDKNTRGRATQALERIAEIRSKEDATERMVLDDTRVERVFGAAFAAAFVGPPSTPIKGTFETPHGRIPFRQEKEKIIGNVEFREEMVEGFGALFQSVIPPLPGASPKFKVRTLRFSANVFGRAGRFRLEISEREENSIFDIPKSSVVEGLLIISEDGESLEVLEEHDKKVKTYTARKVSS